MIATKTPTGFVQIRHPHYLEPYDPMPIIAETESSFLWVGGDHFLDRNEVCELIQRMQYWLEHKQLENNI